MLYPIREKTLWKVINNDSVKRKDQTIEGTHFFVATGRKGNAAGFGFEELGVELHKQNFNESNEYLQTSVPNIYAAGDITGEFFYLFRSVRRVFCC